MYWKTRQLLIERALLIAWFTAVVGCFLFLADYACRPGRASEGPNAWPSDSNLEFQEGVWNILVFMHPKCPCSRATMTELGQILAGTKTKIATQFVFFQPAPDADSNSEDWTNTELIRSARELTNFIPWFDAGAVESRRFGATTSGHVMVYSPTRDLQFSGGVTVRRGHEGDNAAADTLSRVLGGLGERRQRYAVYGCPISGCP